jgi:nucleotidyltransferase substrate binding protein (TIGR01987 family)
MYTVNITPRIKAFSKFEQFRKNLNTEQEQAGAIQAFEYCFELCWKIMKKHLENRGKIANSPRETFRMAALEGFILDPEIWFDFLVKRNLTVHTYEEEELAKVVSVLPLFSSEVQAFLDRVKT